MQREWSVRQHTRASSADSCNQVGAQHIYERFCIIGLPPDFDARLEQQNSSLHPEKEDSSAAHRRGREDDGVSGPPYPSCILFTYPSSPPLSRELAASISDFCHPHGITPQALQQDSVDSSLKEIVLDKPHWNRSDYSFVFQMQASDHGGNQDDGPLYGICCYSKEIIQQPSCLISPEGSVNELNKPKLMAPVCYCILSRYPFFDLHFQILHTILSLEKLDQIGDLLDRVSSEEDSVPIVGRLTDGEGRNWSEEQFVEVSSQGKKSSDSSTYETPLVSPTEIHNELEDIGFLSLEQNEFEVAKADQDIQTSDTETPNAPLLPPSTPFFTPAQRSTSQFMRNTTKSDISIEARKMYGSELKNTSNQSRFGRTDWEYSNSGEGQLVDHPNKLELDNLESRMRQVQQLLDQSMATINEQLMQKDTISRLQTSDVSPSSSEEPLVYILNQSNDGSGHIRIGKKDGENANIVSKCILAILSRYYAAQVPDPGERLVLEVNLDSVVSRRNDKEKIGSLDGKETNNGTRLRFAFNRPTFSDVLNDLGLRSEFFLSCSTKSGSNLMEAAQALGAWTVTCLCRTLSLENILTFLTAVLLECRVIVFCPHIGLLTGVVLSLVPLLLPFSWHSLLLPVLPALSPVHLDLLDAPVPYVVGILHKTAEVRSRCGDVVRVNVYKNQVKNSGTPLPSLPQASALADALLGPYTELARLSRTPMIDSKPVHIVTKDQMEVAKWFTVTVQRYLKGLMVDLKGYTITDVSAGAASVQRTSVLLKEPFVDSFSSRDKAFMRQFVETQMFSVYCDAVL